MIITNNWYLSAIILGAALILSFFVKVFLKKVLLQIAGRTKTDFDDLLINALFPPLHLSVFVFGILAGIWFLPIAQQYKQLISKISFVTAVLIATWTLLRLTRKLSVWVVRFKKGREKEEGAKFGTIFKRSLDIIIYTVAGIIILNFFGIKVTPILATLGVGGIAVALALQDTLENFFSGFYIVTDKSVKLGDLIELEGGAIKGHVEDIGWRTTRIKTLSGNMIIIPNSKLSQAITTNYDLQNKQTSVIIPVSVSYDSDLEKVEKTSEQVAKKIQKNTKGAVSAFEPIIRYNMFGDNGIHFKVILKAEHETGKYLIKHEFIKALHKEFKKQKIEMPYPQMDVHLKK